ncbi:MAG: hypothetical protein HN728_00390, partial [Flavobacteriales bacterium]|nr:hypothetical protein [Flavobacteriales bacterium]
NQQSFFRFYEAFIREHDPLVGRLRRLEFRRTYDHLVAFEEAEKYRIDWDTITVEFFNRFRAFLTSLEYSTNYQIKFFKMIKQIMRLGLIRKVHDNRSFEERSWRIREEPFDSIYLTEVEIKKIAKTTVPSKLQNSKEWLVMGCYLGLRFEDLMGLSMMNIRQHRGVDVIRVEQSKTKELVVILQL